MRRPPAVLAVALACLASVPPLLAQGQQQPAADPVLSELLAWTLEHTDLEKLHERAESVRQGAVLSAAGNQGALPAAGGAGDPASASPQALTAERLAELKQVGELLMRDDFAVMVEAMERAANATLSPPERVAALENLQTLVEDIDNAKDFMVAAQNSSASSPSSSGYAVVVALLGEDAEELQANAAWVLGTAAQNNPDLQRHLLDIGAVPPLLALLDGRPDGVRGKALFATSSLVRSFPPALHEFEELGGTRLLLELLAAEAEPPAGSLRLVLKVLVLLSDLLERANLSAAEAHPASPALAAGSSIGRAIAPNVSAVCGAALACLSSSSVDAQEKAVHALEQLDVAGLLSAHPHAEHGGDVAGCAAPELRAALHALAQQCEADADRCDPGLPSRLLSLSDVLRELQDV